MSSLLLDFLAGALELELATESAVFMRQAHVKKPHPFFQRGATRSGDSCLLPINSNTLTVWGSTGFGAGNMFIGALDELVIFNGRAFSQKEIQYFMDTGAFAVEPAGKLVTSWSQTKSAY